MPADITGRAKHLYSIYDKMAKRGREFNEIYDLTALRVICERVGEEGTRDFVLVDVREPNEYEINKIPGSVLIPKAEFLNGNAFEQLSQEKQVVLHCKSGVRSAEALAVLKGAGYSDAVHVGGGVVAWVNQVDPSQPSY